MIRLLQRGRPIFILMLALCLLTSLPHPSALAALIPTGAMSDPAAGMDNHEKVRHFLTRAEVRAALLAQGIDPMEAEARVAGLTDAEVAQIAGRIDELPAGGILGAAIAVLLIVLLIVVILRLVGKL
ncbi:MAG: PA2779 family protein [Desulfobacterales bacterium]|jgi:hypothetical protein|nr:PA2779 family protein [Desulfobacterales bacterium]